MLKLPEYARRMGISRSHAYQLFIRGELPHSAEKVGPRTILVDVPHDWGLQEPPKKTVAYIRVSSAKQKESLNQQKLRVLEYCAKNGIHIDGIYEEVASGMNENREKLNKILEDPTIGTIVVEHRERLSRINFRLIESALKAQQRSVVVIDDTEVEDDLVRDMTEVLASFCARFYGRRGSSVKAQKIVQEVVDGSVSKE